MADLISSSKANPCPICSREKDGDCRISAELVLCHHGSNHHPPEHLKRGDVITGADGQQWAFTGDTSDGRAATFTIHKPLEVPSPDALTRGAEGVWRYSSTFYVCRFPKKRIRPLSWIDGGWRWRGPGSDRPMLLSHPLATRPNTTVLIVEGEKTWDAARRLFPGLVVCCWSGGCKAISQTNFTALAGRKVVLWPDNDDAGRDAMQEIAQVLHRIGATSAKVVANPADAQQGWDLADATDWTPADATAWVKANTSTVEEMAAAPTTTKSKPEPLTFEQRWESLELHAAELACTTWPVMKTVASLASKASELEIPRLGQRQLEQLLEQAQRKVRAKSEPVMGGGTFTIQPTPWAVDGLFRHGLNLLVGQSGAGKSRLAAACMASWLRGDATWLQRRLHGIEARNRHALIVGTDQSLTDWHLTLGPVGLTTKISDTEVRVHDRLTLYGLESGLQLDADGLNTIRRWVDAHPGGMVLVDSLAQCLPAGIDEDKSSAARPVHQLQEVLGDAWAILTHHTRKGAGKEGNIGVGAGRGSGAIDAAVSRVIGLGLIHKMENGQLVAQESDPRRELLSTKRGGKTEHLIVSSDASGFWDLHGTADALKAQERQQRALSNLTDAQSDVLAAVEAADGWISTRDVVKTLLADGEEYDATSGKAATARKALKRLEVLGLIETQRVGNDRSYRAVEPAEQREVDKKGSTGSTLIDTGISLAQPLAQPGSTQTVEPPEPPAEQVEPVEPVEPLPEPMAEPAKPTAAQGLSRLSHPPVQAVQSTGSTIPGFVDPEPVAVGSGADAMAHDDDPHWPKRPEAA